MAYTFKTQIANKNNYGGVRALSNIKYIKEVFMLDLFFILFITDGFRGDHSYSHEPGLLRRIKKQIINNLLTVFIICTSLCIHYTL